MICDPSKIEAGRGHHQYGVDPDPDLGTNADPDLEALPDLGVMSMTTGTTSDSRTIGAERGRGRERIETGRGTRTGID